MSRPHPFYQFLEEAAEDWGNAGRSFGLSQHLSKALQQGGVYSPLPFLPAAQSLRIAGLLPVEAAQEPLEGARVFVIRHVAADIRADHPARAGGKHGLGMAEPEDALIPIGLHHVFREYVLVDGKIDVPGIRQCREQPAHQFVRRSECSAALRPPDQAQPRRVRADAPIRQLAPQEGRQAVLPRVGKADVPRGDADDMDAPDARQQGGVRHPRTAMDAEGIAHVVRVVVENDHIKGRGRQAAAQAAQRDQRDVVEVAAAHERTAAIHRQHAFQMGFQRTERPARAAEAYGLLPRAQRDAAFALRHRQDRAVEIKDHRRGRPEGFAGVMHDPYPYQPPSRPRPLRRTQTNAGTCTGCGAGSGCAPRPDAG